MTQPSTTMPRVCVLDGGYTSYAIETRLLLQAGYVLDAFPGDRHDLPGKIAFAQGAQGVFIRWSEFNDPVFAQLPDLKYLVRYGVGYDNVDLDAATRHGVSVCNVQGYASHSVSDHALALMLSCVRALPLGRAKLRSDYGTPPRPHLPELKDMTLGIVGLGRIGGALCQKARGLFRRVIAADPYIPKARFKEVGAQSLSLDALLAASEVISIHCTLTEETRHLMNRETIARMRPGSILINTARGSVCDELALLEALDSGQLYAAGLDVFEDEPPLEDRDTLINHPNVVATGHYGWFSDPAHVELQRRAAENMVRMLRGEIPDDCLNPGLGTHDP